MWWNNPRCQCYVSLNEINAIKVHFSNLANQSSNDRETMRNKNMFCMYHIFAFIEFTIEYGEINSFLTIDPCGQRSDERARKTRQKKRVGTGETEEISNQIICLLVCKYSDANQTIFWLELQIIHLLVRRFFSVVFFPRHVIEAIYSNHMCGFTHLLVGTRELAVIINIVSIIWSQKWRNFPFMWVVAFSTPWENQIKHYLFALIHKKTFIPCAQASARIFVISMQWRLNDCSLWKVHFHRILSRCHEAVRWREKTREGRRGRRRRGSVGWQQKIMFWQIFTFI